MSPCQDAQQEIPVQYNGKTTIAELPMESFASKQKDVVFHTKYKDCAA
jgi:hypothetical protein